MYNVFVKKILYPLYALKQRSSHLERLKFLEDSQWWTTDQLFDYQFERLKEIVSHAFETVPFYQKKMRMIDFHPGDLKAPDDISLLPFVTKDDLQKHRAEMISTDFSIGDLQEDASGGSTGKPTIFYKNRVSVDVRLADQIRHDRWCGWDIGKKSLYVWGAQRDINLYKNWKLQILDKYLYRIHWVDAFDLNEQKLFQFKAVIEEYRPAMILAYANALYFIAKYLHKHDISVGGLKGIITSAETLTPEMRTLIENVFSCKVLNRYGSREVGLVASECPEQQGMHVNAENIFIETIPFSDESGLREVVVTDLSNLGMPLIRYRMGDMVAHAPVEKCSCGRGLPLIGQIIGRSADFLVGRGGRYIHGEYFTHLFYGVQGVKEFHLIQEELDRVCLSLAVGSSFSRESIHQLEEGIISQFDKGLKLEIEFVDNIAKPASGKFRFTESKVAI